jgi:trimeric autotransporter adhesin
MKYKFSLFTYLFVLVAGSAIGQGQFIATFAGNGIAAFGGDGNVCTDASFWGPLNMTFDKAGNLYVVDFNNRRVRKIAMSDRTITTVAGNGIQGHTGDGSYATNADMSPFGVAMDTMGNLYISDPGYGVIRKVNNAQIVSTYAGGPSYGYYGDGGPASASLLNTPYGLAIDDTGNLYIADAGNHVVRKINTAGVISTVAGTGVSGYSGDGSSALLATLDSPYAVTVDHLGDIYITDLGNNVIREVLPTGIIFTAVGTGVYGYSGDGNAAGLATLNGPKGLAVDAANNLYIADAYNNVVRKVTYSNSVISTVVGNGSLGYSGDLGYALGCNLNDPTSVLVDSHGDIFVTDANNERVRYTYNENVGVPSVSSPAAVSVSPNPFSSTINFTGLNTGFNVAVYDMLGRNVVKGSAAGSSTLTVTTPVLPAGMYLVKVTGADGAVLLAKPVVKE